MRENLLSGKIFPVVWILIIIFTSGMLTNGLIRNLAREKTTGYNKYYTSVRLEEGDTLWNLAERYNKYSVKSMEEYIRELKNMNCLTDDKIHAGNYLTVSYYEVTPAICHEP